MSGSNIVNVQKAKEGDNNQPPDVVSIREIGGSMAPIWKNMVEAGKTQVNSHYIYHFNLTLPVKGRSRGLIIV